MFMVVLKQPDKASDIRDYVLIQGRGARHNRIV